MSYPDAFDIAPTSGAPENRRRLVLFRGKIKTAATAISGQKIRELRETQEGRALSRQSSE